MSLFDIVTITGPICIVVIVGYLSVWGGLIAKSGVSAIAGYASNIALPMALFQVMAKQDFEQTSNLSFILGFGIGSALTFMAAMALAMLVLRRGLTSASLYGMGSSFSNGIMIGIPVMALLFGDFGPFAVALMLLAQTMVLVPTSIMLCDIGQARAGSLGQMISNAILLMIKNPLIIGIFSGLAIAYFGIEIPAIAETSIDIIATTGIGVGLFSIGALLFGAPMRGRATSVFPVVVFKLLLHPVLVFGVMLLLDDVDPLLKTCAVIMASFPMIGIYPSLAERYGEGQNAAAAALPTTIISFFTSTATIWLLLAWQPFGDISARITGL